MFAILWYVLLGLAVLLFLGLCRHCYHLDKQFYRCDGCGATRPETGVLTSQTHTHTQTVVVYRTVHRCDGPTEKCRQGLMVLVVRRWTWWLTRPFAWMWAPLPALLDTLSKIARWKF